MATEQNERQLKFERSGPLAIRATAIGVLLDCVPGEAAFQAQDGIATVTIRGPLVQHNGGVFDSYEAVFARVVAACQSDAKAVVLKVHSPGGDVFGTFETARAMAALFEASGKDSVAYVEGEASSAAYALAIACKRVVLTETSIIGSVGVINTLVSCARADAAMGLDFVLVTSGARKADGNPHAPITDGAIVANQRTVDDLAGVFWRWVQERRGIDPVGFEAGIFVGARAVAAGLADEIDTESNLRANLARGITSLEAKPMPAETQAQAKGPTMADQKENVQAVAPKASAFTEATAALAKAIEDGDDAAKSRARKAMKALLAEDKDESGEGEEKKEAKATSDEGDKDEKKEEAKAVSAVSSPAASNSLDAEIRASLIASRPDLANDAKLQAKFSAASLVDLKTAIETMPKAVFTAPAQPVAGTRGAADPNARFVPSSQKELLAEQMGLSKATGPRVTRGDGITVFGGSSEQIDQVMNQYHADRSAQGSK